MERLPEPYSAKLAAGACTMPLDGPTDPKIELENTDDGFGHLTYKSVASGGEEDKPYELELTLFKAVRHQPAFLCTCACASIYACPPPALLCLTPNH